MKQNGFHLKSDQIFWNQRDSNSRPFDLEVNALSTLPSDKGPNLESFVIKKMSSKNVGLTFQF